ncbi:MAG: alginate export family protein [Burkholderiaceae bacterium]|jgi:hypothetical protein|nr:alginate export family protein [Burkholderiales bacterium]MCZ8105972.1 alginate export family protein [Burkholderiales bacterium]MCZ8340264.1 alginate export family protein [Burkholderiaceae bacterium]
MTPIPSHLRILACAFSALVGALFEPRPGIAQPAAAAASQDGFSWTLDAAGQGLFAAHAFWGLAQTFAPTAGYDSRGAWFETYVRPGVTVRRALDAATAVYGGVSLVASGTLGDDVFLQGDTGRVLVDDAYLGVRRTLRGGTVIDASAGAQRYMLGHGLLLAVGAGNGYERGAVTLAPRRAWGNTAIVRATHGPATVEAFWLDPNELASSDTGTQLAGGRAQWAPDASTSFGVAWFEVLRSTAPYPQAPVRLIENGRDGLAVTDLHARWAPTTGPLAGLSVSGELAIQRNDRIAMKAIGWGGEVGWRIAGLPLQPRVSWSPRYFSGDQPGTPDRLERFDPLFYDASPATWSSGGNGSLAFYNSNLRVDRFRVDLTVSPRDFVNLNYWNVRAAQADSPIQYGQAGRLVGQGGGVALVSGVPVRPLTQELYAEWTRALSQRVFLTAGFGIAVPDDGLKALVPTGARTWVGGLLNLAYRH